MPQTIIGPSAFERLIDKISNEKQIYEKRLAAEENAKLLEKAEQNMVNSLQQQCVDGRKELGKSIMSVYYYLRSQHGLPRRYLTKEEFLLVEARLKAIAEYDSKIFSLKDLFAFRRRRRWRYYLKHGYFNSQKSPFGKWAKYHPSFDGYQERYSDTSVYVPPFHPDEINEKTSQIYSMSVPENFRKLLDELWKERKSLYIKETN